MVAGRPIRTSPIEDIDPYLANVVAHLRFDGNLLDDAGGSYSAVGDISFAAGRNGQCLSLANSGTSGVVGDIVDSRLDLPGDFTIECWVKPSPETDVSTLVTRFHNRSNGVGWQIFVSGGKLNFYHWTGTSGPTLISAAGPDIRDGLFHHAAVLRDNSSVRLYLDRELIGSATSTLNYTSTVALLSIGYQVQGTSRYPLRGSIDEVRITKGVARPVAHFLH